MIAPFLQSQATKPRTARTCHSSSPSRERTFLLCCEFSWQPFLPVRIPQIKLRFSVTGTQAIQLNKTKMTLSPLRNILLMNLSLLTPFAFPFAFSVHISFTFSRTILQWRSNALTRASSFRLFRHEIRTCVCVRVAVMRIERGPVDSSCASRRETSYSLGGKLA